MGEIDYVVPMVFPDDALWRRDFEGTISAYSSKSARWRSWGTEELLIQLVKKNMPWLHDIIIILARESQRQPWMKDVRVVYHRDFIPSALLPVFNVNTIEMYLHKIPDLSERFIYGNDDMFPLSPLKETDFFREGLPCQSLKENPFPKDYNIFYIFVREGLNMIASRYGKRYTDTYLSGGHSIAPFLKESFREVWKRHKDRILGSFTEKRSPENFNQYIFSYLQHFEKKCIGHVPKHSYVSVKKSPKEIVGMIEDPNAGILCINDNGCVRDCKEYATAVRKALKKRIKEG